MGVTQGTWSWLGPLGNIDLGITEKYFPNLGMNPNRYSPVGQQSGLAGSTVSTYPQSSGGKTTYALNKPSVLSSQTQDWPSSINPVPGFNGTTSNQSGRGGGDGGGGSGGGGQDKYLQQLYDEIDRIYGETMGFVGNQENRLRANQPTVEADIEGQYQGSRKSLETEKTTGERSLDEAKTEAGGIKEDAATAARRLYNELKQSGQQRWGEVSSAGEAFGELTGREFQRSRATAQKAYQTAVMKVENLRANLQERFDSAMYNLEVQKNSAINEARRFFQEKLSEIEGMKLQASENKSQMRLSLLQDLRNQVYQINLAAVQTSTALAQQKQQSDAELQQYMTMINQGNTASEQATNEQAMLSPTNQSTAYDVTGDRQQMAYLPTGSINKREDELFA